MAWWIALAMIGAAIAGSVAFAYFTAQNPTVVQYYALIQSLIPLTVVLMVLNLVLSFVRR